MRVSPIFIAGLAVACAGSPPPAPKPAAPEVVAAPAEPEKAPPPEPLAMEDIELTVKDGFAGVGLGNVRPKLWSEDELVKRLPFAAKREIEAMRRARKASRDASRKASKASYAVYRCRECRERAQLLRASKAARKASTKARDALNKAIDHAEQSLDKQLASPKAKPEIGVALARIRANRTLSAAADHWVRYGEADASENGTVSLQDAAELAAADTEVGRQVRYELLNRLWGEDDGQAARRVIAELADGAKPEWRAELEFHAAVYDALDGDHAKAAEGFERALAAHVPGSTVTRKTLALAALVARYRTLDFERALSAAFTAFDEAARPEPRAPEPPAPPKPKLKPKPISPKAAREAALSQATEFGMMGLLGTSSLGGGSFDENDIARLAADSVEQLDRDPTKLTGSPEGRARILSVLAIRALYRNDADRARELAEAARALGPLAGTRGALDVLEALAFRDDDLDRAKDISKERSKLRPGTFRTWAGSAAEPDERDLVARLKKARGDAASDKKEEAPEPPATGNVRSAVRACIEPVRTELPKATGNGKERRIAILTLRAQVFPDGKVELAASADRAEGSVPTVLACLRTIGPRLLAHAPSSVTARVTLNESVRRASAGFGGMWGDQIGEAFGAGGLGLTGIGKGGGGTGTGIGIGSLGSSGSVGGLGYIGRPGAAKPPPKVKKPKKKTK